MYADIHWDGICEQISQLVHLVIGSEANLVWNTYLLTLQNLLGTLMEFCLGGTFQPFFGIHVSLLIIETVNISVYKKI